MLRGFGTCTAGGQHDQRQSQRRLHRPGPYLDNQLAVSRHKHGRRAHYRADARVVAEAQGQTREDHDKRPQIEVQLGPRDACTDEYLHHGAHTREVEGAEDSQGKRGNKPGSNKPLFGTGLAEGAEIHMPSDYNRP